MYAISAFGREKSRPAGSRKREKLYTAQRRKEGEAE